MQQSYELEVFQFLNVSKNQKEKETIKKFKKLNWNTKWSSFHRTPSIVNPHEDEHRKEATPLLYNENRDFCNAFSQSKSSRN